MRNLILLALCFIIGFSMMAQSPKELWQMYNNGQFAKVIEKGTSILKQKPNNGEIALAVGRSYCDINQHEQALDFLNKSTGKASAPWVRAWAHFYLGLSYTQLNDVDQAKANYTSCIQLNATKNSVRSARNKLKFLEVTSMLNQWPTYETPHFIFHFQDKAAITDLTDYMQQREDAYDTINTFFDAEVPKKIDYYIWSRPNEAKNIFGQELGWANPKAVSIHSRIDQTRGHEMTHILCFYAYQPTLTTRLINEGVAVYFDQTQRDRMVMARKSLNGAKLDVLKYWATPGGVSNDYNYTVGGALIDWLLKHGSE